MVTVHLGDVIVDSGHLMIVELHGSKYTGDMIRVTFPVDAEDGAYSVYAEVDDPGRPSGRMSKISIRPLPSTAENS